MLCHSVVMEKPNEPRSSDADEADEITVLEGEEEEDGAGNDRFATLTPMERIEILMRDVVETVKKTLQVLAARELTGDSNEGVTETTFKLLLIQAILCSPYWKMDSDDDMLSLEIMSEFEFPGSRRADIVILASSLTGNKGEKRENDVLYAYIIEVKYARTGFIDGVYSNDHRRFHKNLARMSAAIDTMSTHEHRLLLVKQQFNGRQKTVTWKSVGDIFDEAESEQCVSYRNLMRAKYGSRLTEVKSQVIMGVSRKILVGHVLPKKL